MTPARAPHGWRLSAEARWMLPGCIALSVAAHALLLTGMAPPGPRPGGLPHAASRVARPASVRIVSEPQASGIAASAIAPAPQASGVPQVPAGGSSAASAPAQASSAGVRLSPAVLASTTLSAGEPAAPADAVDGGYIPRPFLSIAPNALAPVDIPTSPETAVPGRHVGVLALYIDELGRVRRIEAEQPALPEAMERAAREAFMAARFSPGLRRRIGADPDPRGRVGGGVDRIGDFSGLGATPSAGRERRQGRRRSAFALSVRQVIAALAVGIVAVLAHPARPRRPREAAFEPAEQP